MELCNKGIDYQDVFEFYKNKRVLITGNTGFKGSWLTYLLLSACAKVTGYSLQPPTSPSLFNILNIEQRDGLTQYYADVRDLDKMKEVFKKTHPEIVFHLAAQPIVRDSFKDPVTTYSTNVMGIVNVCECVCISAMRSVDSRMDGNGYNGVRSFLNITTDKVYKNLEWEWGYRENDELDGLDPYSNSKSCSELVTHSYRDSFFNCIVDEKNEPVVRVSTARAGNVIGGGDFSNDRIVPDCVRALSLAVDEQKSKGMIAVRNPYSIRPYEHVLEPLFAYMMIAKAQYENARFAGYYNVGPDDQDCVSTGKLVTMLADTWNRGLNANFICGSSKLGADISLPMLAWENKSDPNAPHEANFLKLDCSKLKRTFGWKPRWHIEDAVKNTVAWTRVWLESNGDSEVVKIEMDREIEEFIK